MSDLDKMQDELKEKTTKTISREEFEELKNIIKEILEKLKTRTF